MHDYTWIKTQDRGDRVLSFAAPLLPLGAEPQYDFRCNEIIVEDDTGYGRADYSIWQRDPETGCWNETDSEPGIVQLLADQQYDDPCADCVDHAQPDEIVHDPDCPIGGDDVDDDAWDSVEGYYCCTGLAWAMQEAHRLWRESQDIDPGCTLHPEYVLLDGGDVVCRAHLEEEIAPILHLDASPAAEMQRNYFATRRNVNDQQGPVSLLPDPRVLYDLADLDRMRRQLEQADRLRMRRDDIVARLRGSTSQQTLADAAGITQQRVAQIQRDADAAAAEIRRRIQQETHNQ